MKKRLSKNLKQMVSIISAALLLVACGVSASAAEPGYTLEIDLPIASSLDPKTLKSESFTVTDGAGVQAAVDDVLYYPFYTDSLCRIQLSLAQAAGSGTVYTVAGSGVRDVFGNAVNISATVQPSLSFESFLDGVFMQSFKPEKTAEGKWNTSAQLINSSRTEYTGLICYLALYKEQKMVYLKPVSLPLSAESAGTADFGTLPAELSWDRAKVLVFDSSETLRPIQNSGYEFGGTGNK